MATKIRASNLHTDVTTLIQSLGGGADLYAAETTSSTNPIAEGILSIAIGSGADASGFGSAHSNISIGVNSDALATTAIALGYNAQADGQGGMSLGRNSKTATGTQAVALTQSYASGADSFAASTTNNTSSYGAQGANSIAIGYRTKSTQTGAISLGYHVQATAQISTAIGAYTYASGSRSFAFGNNTTASHSYSMSLGELVTSTASYQVNVGGSTQDVRISETYTLPKVDGTSGQSLTTDGSGVVSWATAGGGADLYAANESSPTAQPSATGGNAIAIGDGATASSNDSVAIGLNAQATYFVSVAIGENSTASGNRALALGRTSTASGSLSTAMGLNSGASGPYATGDGSMAFGSSRATGIDSFAVAIGNNTTSYGAQGADGISIGKLSKVTNTRTTAVGEYAFATHSEGAAFGYLARATNNYSLALGARSVSSSTATVALSFESEASAYGSVAIGILSKSTASHSTAFASSRASGSHSFSAGITNNTTSYGASGANSIAIGYQAKATSTKSLAIGGSSNSSTGNYSSVIGGASSSASGVGSFAMGFSCIADADYSYAKGDMGKTNGILHKHAVGLNNGQQGANYLLGHTTSDATPIALNTQIWTPSASNQITLQDYTAFIFSGTVVAREKGSTGTDVGAWEVKGVIRRESGAGTTVLVNSVINEINVPTGWEINLTADTSFGCLKVEATGAASTSIKWLATIKTAEVTYA